MYNYPLGVQLNRTVNGKTTYLSYFERGGKRAVPIDMHPLWVARVEYVIGKVKDIRENCNGNYHDIVLYNDKNLRFLKK